MKSWKSMKRKIKKGKKLHFTLIDPGDQSPEEAAEIAKIAEEAGSDAIMVGGSTKITRARVSKTIKAIKKVIKRIPVILFPNSAKAISKYADYIFFMMLINSRRIDFLTGEQFKGAPLVKKWKLKTISMGYILVSMSKEPTTVERIADPDQIRKRDFKKAVNYALISQYSGMECVYLEAGSGADEPVLKEMISAVRKAINIEIPIIVGGAIKDGKTAAEKIKAGADIIVTGNIVESEAGRKRLKGIISAIKKDKKAPKALLFLISLS